MTKHNPTRYLTVSLLIVVGVCVVVFSILGYYYRARSNEAIEQVSQIYLTNVNERLQAHFDTAVDYSLSRLDSITAEVVPESMTSATYTVQELTRAASHAGFMSVSLMGQDSLLESIYGEPLSLLYPENVYMPLMEGNTRIGIGRIGTEQVEACAVPASYPMSDGQRSIGVLGVLSENFLQSILALDQEGSVVTSYIIRSDGSYVLRNDEYGENYYADVRAESPGDAGAGAERYLEALQEALDKSETYSGTYTGVDGHTFHVLATPLAYSQWYLLSELSDGALTQAVGDLGSDAMILVLISCLIIVVALGIVFIGYYRLSKRQLEEIERSRAEAESANRAKSEFFSNMSHDIRTPMNAIVGMTAIGLSKIDNKDAVRNSLEKIKLSSKQLLGLINDVLDMSRIESGNLTLHMEPMSLRDFMDSAVAIIQPQIAAKRQEFDVYAENVTVEDVYCDAVRLNQVLLNLLANAVKFTPEGGRITLAMYETPSALGDKYITVNIDVSDTGIGMSPGFQEVIFESFAREDVAAVQKTEGVGLGMAITKYIIDAMNGTISLESTQGQGTHFHIALDLAKAETPEVKMTLPPRRVLIIDDDALNGESARGTLEAMGVHADTVLDGTSGISALKEAAERGEPYDIVLVDWKLPYMSGVQTAQRIREEITDKVSILLMSAYDWADVEDQAREAGIDGFLAKPLFKSTLYYGLLNVIGDVPNKQEQNKFDFTGKRVLVAEDNDINWEIMATLLAQYNFSVDRAANGQEAVARFSASPSNYYDAILMDVHMPVMDGLQATQKIRAMYEDRKDATLPIVAMTADAFADDIRRSMQAGMNAHVSKPIDITEMLRTLAKFLK